MSDVQSTDVIGNWTGSDARRIANSVHAYERSAGLRSNRTPWLPDKEEGFLAQITGESNTSAGWYSWQKQNTFAGQVIQDPSSITSANLSSNAYTAFELNGSTNVASGTNVWMNYAGMNTSNTSCFTFVVGGAAGAGPTPLIVGAANGSNPGIYSGNFSTGTATGINSSGGMIGLTVGAACILVNDVEVQSPGAYPYIKGVPRVLGTLMGTDSATGLPIFLIDAISEGC